MLQAKPVQSVGHATVVYNKDRVLNGTYNCQSESRAGFDKDTIHVELENKWVPVGADYIRSFEYGGSSAAPTTVGASNKSHARYKILPNLLLAILTVYASF